MSSRCGCGGDWQLWSITHWSKEYTEYPESKVGYRELYRCQRCGEEEEVMG